MAAMVMRRVCVMASAAVVVMSCQQAAVNEVLDGSAALLLVPTGEWRDEFEFTAPSGSTDPYQVGWSFSPGATEFVTGRRIASTSNYDEAALAEEPGQNLIDDFLVYIH